MVENRQQSKTTPPLWGILADDFTGAMDVAASFVSAGYSTKVVFNLRSHSAMDAEFVVASTQSRNASPLGAQQRVLKSLTRFQDLGVEILFKKIDSTCKGNLVPEMDMIVDGLKKKCVFCPSNIRQGRTMRDAILQVTGEPQRDVRAILQQQGAKRLAFSRNVSSSDWVDTGLPPGTRILLADAYRESQLVRIAKWGLRNRERWMLVGSADLARSLAFAMKKPSITLPSTSSTPASLRRSSLLPIVLMNGSRNPVTSAQIEALIAHRPIQHCEFSRIGARRATESLACRRDILLQIPTHTQSVGFIREVLAHFTPLFRRETIGGLLVCGGDTAHRIVSSCKMVAVQVQGEIVPGLAWGISVGGMADGVPLCTKPGGFGTKNGLSKAMRFLGSLAVPRTATKEQHP